MSKQLARVRGMVAAHEAGRGKRYPVEVQREVVRYARARRAAGASWTAIADELGLWFETVRRWCSKAEAAVGAIVPVEVVEDRYVSDVGIVSPSGFRLVGLEPAAAVAALKALG